MAKRKILIMEDEESSLNAIKEAFEKHQYEVTTAANGEDGLQVARTTKPDVILLDIIMPKKDGFEVLEELKKDKNTLGIPVILLTNLSQPQDVQRAIELGAKTYLVKAEYQLEDIVGKVEEHLQ